MDYFTHFRFIKVYKTPNWNANFYRIFHPYYQFNKTFENAPLFKQASASKHLQNEYKEANFLP